MGRLAPNTCSLNRTQKIVLSSSVTSILERFFGGRQLCGPWARWARGRAEEGGKAGCRLRVQAQESLPCCLQRRQALWHNHVALILAASGAGASLGLETYSRSSVQAWQDSLAAGWREERARQMDKAHGGSKALALWFNRPGFEF